MTRLHDLNRESQGTEKSCVEKMMTFSVPRRRTGAGEETCCFGKSGECGGLMLIYWLMGRNPGRKIRYLPL